MIAMWGFDTQAHPEFSRMPESFTLFSLGWVFWFTLLFVVYLSLNALLKGVIKLNEKRRIHLIPLALGLSFGPLFKTLLTLEEELLVFPFIVLHPALVSILLAWLPPLKLKAEPAAGGNV
jgi:hypothetical protein